jgi:protein required for attachment to host cells
VLTLVCTQVEHYRKKLLRKALEDTAAPTPRKERTSRHEDQQDSDSERYSRSSKKEKRKKKRDRSSSGNMTISSLVQVKEPPLCVRTGYSSTVRWYQLYHLVRKIMKGFS